MLEIAEMNVTHNKTRSLWANLLTGVLSVFFGYVLTFWFVFEYLPPSGLVYFVFLSTFLVAVIFSNWQYRNKSDRIVYTVLFLIVWAIALFLTIPALTKWYYIRIASDLVPEHSQIQISEPEYITYGVLGMGISVDYKYKTTTLEEDYKIISDLYKTKLEQEDYSIFEATNKSIVFQKNNKRATVFVGVSDKNPNTIEVSVVPERSTCAYYLLFVDIQEFLKCQSAE